MAPAPTRMIVLICRSDDPSLRSPDWSALFERLAGTPGQILRIVVIGDDDPPPAVLDRLVASTFPEGAPPTEVRVLAGEAGAEDPGPPSALILALADLPLASVRSFTLDGADWPYRRAAAGGPRLLYLFPGVIHPVTMGAHRRAATMLASLLRHGFDVEILYTGPNFRAREAAGAFLSLAAVRTVSFSNRRDRLALARVALRREARRLAARLAGLAAPPGETFVERARLRDNRSLRVALRTIDLERFDAVMVNYAWMAPAVLAARSRRPMLVCDTHDVQYYRAASGAASADPPFFPAAAERRAEMRLLRRMDKVLAISPRDAELLAAELGAERVCAAPPSFAYCHRPARTPPPAAALRFGFIGHRMKANVDALALVLDDWWPAIRRWTPESTLSVAGSVCADPAVARRIFLDPSVRPLGFVDSLPAFYDRIDVALSPVVAAGGMNFKNAEALTAGVAVMTNRLGAETLRPLRLPCVVESAEEAVAALRRMESDPEADRAARAALQAEALRVFSSDDAVAAIARELRSRAGACAS